MCVVGIFFFLSIVVLSVMLMMVLPIHLSLPLLLQVIYIYLRSSANTPVLFLYSDKPTQEESLLMTCPSC